MKKTYYIRLAAAICVAGLSTSMLSVAKAESAAVTPNALSLLQNQAQVNAGLIAQPTSPSLFSSTGAGFEANSATIVPNIAYSANNTSFALPTSQTPVQQPFDPIQHYSVIPEPTTISCLALGLGALIGFKRLKIGQKK
jgi:cellobiose-specific phosphotransferase system component IIB